MLKKIFTKKITGPAITVILCAYNRIHLLDEQVHAIRAQSVPVSDIWLWHNKGTMPLSSPPDIKVASCNHNFKFFGRFAFAMLAQTEYVAFFDDDTIPGVNWFQNCMRYMQQSPGILGTTGIKLTKKSYKRHIKIGWNGTNGANQNIEPVDLIGHGWFLKKDWLKYMWYEPPISWENGEDIHLSYTAKKYGNIPSYVLPHPTKDPSVWGSTKGSIYGDDDAASWKKQRNKHVNIRNKIVVSLIEKHWTPLFLEKK